MSKIELLYTGPDSNGYHVIRIKAPNDQNDVDRITDMYNAMRDSNSAFADKCNKLQIRLDQANHILSNLQWAKESDFLKFQKRAIEYFERKEVSNATQESEQIKTFVVPEDGSYMVDGMWTKERSKAGDIIKYKKEVIMLAR